MAGAMYYRGFLLEADTFNVQKSLKMRDAESNATHDYSGGPATNAIKHSGQSQIEYAFATPFVAHLVREEPQDTVAWKKFGIRWVADPWPELSEEKTAWFNMGTPGAKYLRGGVIPIDTNGAAVTMTLTSSDGGSVTLGPFTTTAAVKTPVPWPFSVPLIGHEYQLSFSAACRIWIDEIRWDFDPWPERITEATGWLSVLGGGAAFLQGAVIPVETGGILPSLNLLYDDGTTATLNPIGTPPLNVKTTIPFTLANPVITHNVQIVPSAACRIWLPEIQWVAEPAPELAAIWETQQTSHGMKDYGHIREVFVTYSTNSDTYEVVLAIFADGVEYDYFLPPSAVPTKKYVTTYSVKAKLFSYTLTAVSSGVEGGGTNPAMRLWKNDCGVWVKDWGSSGPYVNVNPFGAAHGAGSRI